MSSDAGGHEPRRYTAQEISASTNNFSRDNSLGRESFGTAYMGDLNGTKVVVLKLTSDQTRNASERFLREVDGLLMVQHENIVNLLGYCPENRCLVYETLPGGNLEDCLSTASGREKLSQFDRLRIAKEVATALLFLHCMEPMPIMHQDVKPANIVLDEKKGSKLGGAGLARFLPVNDSGIWGTVGYIDPLLLKTGRYLPQSDVYGLGLVMLQLLTSEKVNKVLELAKFGLDGIVDNLDSSVTWNTDLVKKVADLALKCRGKSNRPDLENGILPVLEEYVAEAEALDAKEVKKPAEADRAGGGGGGRPVDTKPVDPSKADFPQPGTRREPRATAGAATAAAPTHGHAADKFATRGKLFGFLFGRK
eukprot:TRINITY_DN8754_c0_g1_i1.p1 TRINITY_DN8754_c0_g1~~TRINITY_DN8754_c0_g1_i1.p1  ORF type:complete len:365 (-),score=101.44 TRINITY_DN8754_c0_g1_i1:117-1211(-)